MILEIISEIYFVELCDNFVKLCVIPYLPANLDLRSHDNLLLEDVFDLHNQEIR
jgi:hypothetical protein